MSALPKNKISRVERGKRRRGNTPKLRKDIHGAQPLHKRGFVAELLQFIGVQAAPKASKSTSADKTEKKTTKKADKAATPVIAGTAGSTQPTRSGKSAARSAKAQPAAKTTRKAQHKG